MKWTNEPSRGQSTKSSDVGRIRRLVAVAKMAGVCSGRGLDVGTGNGVVREAVNRATGIPFVGVDIGEAVPDGPFDLITCFDVLEHTHTGEDVLGVIRSRLSDGGRVAITLPHKWWPFETHAVFPANRLPFFNWGPWSGWLRRRFGRSVPCYTMSDLHDLATSSGFKVVNCGYLTAPLDVVRGASLVAGRDTTRFGVLAPNLYGILKKEDR